MHKAISGSSSLMLFLIVLHVWSKVYHEVDMLAAFSILPFTLIRDSANILAPFEKDHEKITHICCSNSNKGYGNNRWLAVRYNRFSSDPLVQKFQKYLTTLVVQIAVLTTHKSFLLQEYWAKLKNKYHNTSKICHLSTDITGKMDNTKKYTWLQ